MKSNKTAIRALFVVSVAMGMLSLTACSEFNPPSSGATTNQRTYASGAPSQNGPNVIQAGVPASPTPVPAQVPSVPSTVTSSAVEMYIDHLYLSTFSRNPDTDGLNFWLDQYNSGAVGCRDMTAGFLKSSENTIYGNALQGVNFAKIDLISQTYKVALWRTPDQGGFDFWYGALVVNNSINANVLVDQFLASNEFQAICAEKGLRY